MNQYTPKDTVGKGYGSLAATLAQQRNPLLVLF